MWLYNYISWKINAGNGLLIQLDLKKRKVSLNALFKSPAPTPPQFNLVPKKLDLTTSLQFSDLREFSPPPPQPLLCVVLIPKYRNLRGVLSINGFCTSAKHFCLHKAGHSIFTTILPYLLLLLPPRVPKPPGLAFRVYMVVFRRQ